jgi:hypothetical protein
MRTEKQYEKELLSEPNFNKNYRAAPYQGLSDMKFDRPLDNMKERVEQIDQLE